MFRLKYLTWISFSSDTLPTALLFCCTKKLWKKGALFLTLFLCCDCFLCIVQCYRSPAHLSPLSERTEAGLSRLKVLNMMPANNKRPSWIVLDQPNYIWTVKELNVELSEYKQHSVPKITLILTWRKQRPDSPASDLEGDSVISSASTCCSLPGSDSNVTDKRENWEHFVC